MGRLVGPPVSSPTYLIAETATSGPWTQFYGGLPVVTPKERRARGSVCKTIERAFMTCAARSSGRCRSMRRRTSNGLGRALLR